MTFMSWRALFLSGKGSKRGRVYDGLFSANSLCVAGLFVMPALLFNPITELRIGQFLFFWFLCWLSGRKTNPVATILVFTVIVVFNLIVPYGRVLFSFGFIKLTFGALMTGINRAVTLEGLIMLSRLSIRRDLKIPGNFGALLGESLKYFSLITEAKHRITGKNLINDIDNLMIDLSEEGTGKEWGGEAEAVVKTKPVGFVFLTIVVMLSWLPLAAQLLCGN